MAAVAEKLSEQVQLILEKRLNENTLTLPAPPTVVMKTMALLRDPNFTPKDASPVIERDSVLAARVQGKRPALAVQGDRVLNSERRSREPHMFSLDCGLST